MQCINHPGVEVKAYCQSCGKPLCSECVQTTPVGHVFCAVCNAAFGGNPSRAYTQPIYPPPPPPGTPNPVVAAFLGLIPGVGAMYNGQFFKGLIHVVVFAVLISITDSYPIFGLFIAAWIFYQSFEAYHTAVARRDGLPVPDPFGLNEIGSWLNLSNFGRGPMPPVTGAQADPQAYPAASQEQQAGYGAAVPPYSEPYMGTPGYPPYAPPPDVPPGGPWMPPLRRRNEPIGAIVLIALGIIFLLQSMGFVSHLIRFGWPLLLIGLGVWMIVSRMGYGQGGPK
uniref:B box-type domain-containing protein n=1 Tax=mine drainage metagenome TaxID=410659 RepID=E6QKW0_9ZZZZ